MIERFNTDPSHARRETEKQLIPMSSLALKEARLLLYALLKPPVQNTKRPSVAFTADIQPFCDLFATQVAPQMTYEEKNGICAEARETGVLTADCADIAVAADMLSDDWRSTAIELATMMQDRDPQVHPPRTFAYDASHLAALRDMRWDPEGFENMELSALPWMAWEGEGRCNFVPPCGALLPVGSICGLLSNRL